MGLVKCPDCGKMVSSRAINCPDCGCPAEFFAHEESNDESVGSSESKQVIGIDESDIEPIVSKQLEKTLVENKKVKARSAVDIKRDVHSSLKKALRMTKDYAGIEKTNVAFILDLEKRLNCDYHITYISSSNVEEKISSIINGNYEYPYVIVSADFQFNYGQHKYKFKNLEGISNKLYFDDKKWSSEYAPTLEIISSNVEDINGILEKVKEAYKESITLDIPILDGKLIEIGVKYETNEEPRHITGNDDDGVWTAIVKFSKSKYVALMDKDNIKTSYLPRERYRKVQTALYYAELYKKKSDFIADASLYKILIEEFATQKPRPQGLLSGMAADFMKGAKQTFGPKQNKEYIKLKELVANGASFDSKLVDGAFPNVTLFYHNLPNDIANKKDPSNLENMVNSFMDGVQGEVTRICKELGIPRDVDPFINASDREKNMQTIDGLTYILNKLDENMEKNIEDVVAVYKSELWDKVEERQRQIEAQRERRRIEEEIYGPSEHSSGGGLISSIAKDAISGRIANAGIEKQMRLSREEASAREKQRQKEAKRLEEEARRDKWISDFHEPSEWARKNLDRYKK
ncbi:zinc ribbon domain-containing protein [Butyrivibrio sp.]|uniref:zinc ribbon domain-containing protein n=1 Tax=Butyrivibrio sp. TaxID=28121 RepID=UPI0025C13DB7|nr:zinc ribbon domain-containing protein [Butyrivibrio sp.]MBQ9303241.1 zinc ribbon domain-containing protein [Butyrivibrio sp.]